MFGFLSKVILMAVVVAVIGTVVYMRRGSLPNPNSLLSEVRDAVTHVDTGLVWNNLSASLDNLVTHPDKNSPVVLGIKVTNESLSTVVDVIQNLPPGQVSEIKAALCTSASPSAR